MIKIGALWNSQGKPFATGKLGQYAKLIVLPNNKKQNEKSPDYWVFLAEDEKKEGGLTPPPTSQSTPPEPLDPVPF
ncbi:MAG: hypothetical protein MI745_14155 [Pseudomonadales bacterium]|nr:hypothetical protein [Pseudomonadales bacterium]